MSKNIISNVDLLGMLLQANEVWAENMQQERILSWEEFCDRYDEIKDCVWKPNMSPFFKNHHFTKAMLFAHYLMVQRTRSMAEEEEKEHEEVRQPNLRLVHSIA